MKPEILEAVKRSGAVPSMPQVVTRFLEIIQQPEFNYDELVAVLSTDPGTAADTLRLSNSALFGVSRKITSLRQAAMLLGPRRVRSLVLGRYMVETVGKSDIGEFDSSYFWRRSLTCGVLGARFADVLAPQLREEAFIAGLLSDVGITILAQEMPEDYAAVLKLYRPHGQTDIAQAEVDAVGVTHAEMSAVVLEFWALPELICQAVANHQSDVAANTEAIQLARIINAADRIAKLLCESPEIENLAEECNAAVAYVDLDLAVLMEMIEVIEADVAELARMLKLDVVASSVYALIAKAIKEQVAE